MFSITEDFFIYATRGDCVAFYVEAEDNGVKYTFAPGDVVRFKVFEKKNCNRVVLEKCFSVTEETDRVSILLTKEDTTIGEVISKPKDYWYEIELNPFTNPQTILGYDEDGAKVLRLYPEGAAAAVYLPEEEPVYSQVDEDFSGSSGRPIANRAVTRAFLRMESLIAELEAVLAFATDAERLHFLSRFGCTVDENGFVKWNPMQGKEAP